MKSSVKAPVRKRIPKKTSVSTVHKKASEARAAIENNAGSSVITSKPDDIVTDTCSKKRKNPDDVQHPTPTAKKKPCNDLRAFFKK